MLLQRHESMHGRSFEQLLTRLRETKRRQARSRGLDPYMNAGINRADVFSELFARLRVRPVIILASVLLSFLLLSIACDQVLGQ